MNAEIVVIVENSVNQAQMLAEHGWACWIKYGQQRVLFDAGQGMVLTGNAYKLQIPLHEADAVVLSHGHYDHSGGLVDALQNNTWTRLFAHPTALAAKFHRGSDGNWRDVGMPRTCQLAIERLRRPYTKTEQPVEIAAGLFVTGAIPRVTDFEPVNGSFFCDRNGNVPDCLEDDQALFLQTAEGTVVLLGCAHAGVINTLRYIQQLTDNQPIHAVLGGMHLVHATDERIEKTITELRRLSVRVLAPAHCTGEDAIAQLRTAFPHSCVVCRVGSRFCFGTQCRDQELTEH